MKTADFDYILPQELIAQTPTNPRDHSRIMVLDRAAGTWQHRRFFEIGEFLRPGDLLIVNESKVFKARLMTMDRKEVFLLRPQGAHWIALGKPRSVEFPDGTTAELIEKREDGTILLDFKKSPEEIFRWCDRVGQVPIPPYINSQLGTRHSALDTRHSTLLSDYQTVYAKTVGSVAAPTAGFHFTPELIEKLKSQGARFASVTLHVGLGTFRPIKTETLDEHAMHEEWIDVPDDTRSAIHDTRARGGRVIAVGTTTVRALESETCHGFTNIFITPGYQFKIIDGLITNFHLPKSTLLVLVSALAGRDLVMKAYAEAINKKYRFYSFGDAMLIV